jgi:hypothetical protein
MSLPRFIDISGQRYLWREPVTLRQPRAESHGRSLQGNRTGLLLLDQHRRSKLGSM